MPFCHQERSTTHKGNNRTHCCFLIFILLFTSVSLYSNVSSIFLFLFASWSYLCSTVWSSASSWCIQLVFPHPTTLFPLPLTFYRNTVSAAAPSTGEWTWSGEQWEGGCSNWMQLVFWCEVCGSWLRMYADREVSVEVVIDERVKSSDRDKKQKVSDVCNASHAEFSLSNHVKSSTDLFT